MQQKLRFALPILLLFVFTGCTDTSTPTALEASSSTQSTEDVATSYTSLMEQGTSVAGVASPATEFPAKEKITVPTIDGRPAFYIDREEWRKSLSKTLRIATEDFEGSNFRDFSVGTCPGPVVQATGGNGCFPGRREILKIVNVDNVADFYDPFGLAVLTPGFLGLSSTVVGPNFFSDDLIIRFRESGVQYVGFDLIDPLGGSQYDVLVYGQFGLIRSFVANPGFIGINERSSIFLIQVISRGPGPGGELIDNFTFNYVR